MLFIANDLRKPYKASFREAVIFVCCLHMPPLKTEIQKA